MSESTWPWPHLGGSVWVCGGCFMADVPDPWEHARFCGPVDRCASTPLTRADGERLQLPPPLMAAIDHPYREVYATIACVKTDLGWVPMNLLVVTTGEPPHPAPASIPERLEDLPEPFRELLAYENALDRTLDGGHYQISTHAGKVILGSVTVPFGIALRVHPPGVPISAENALCTFFCGALEVAPDDLWSAVFTRAHTLWNESSQAEREHLFQSSQLMRERSFAFVRRLVAAGFVTRGQLDE